MRRWTRGALGLLVLGVPLVLTQLPPVQRACLRLVDVMRHAGAPGYALYALAYALGAVLLAPTALLVGLAGFAYGPAWGVAAAVPASVFGHGVAFLVGRFGARGWLTRRMQREPRWDAISAAVGRDGFRIALLLRLTPVVPQNFLSYILAMTRVSLAPFAAATALGLLPITCMYAYLGSVVHDASELLDGRSGPSGPWRWVSLGAGLMVSGVTVAITSRVAGRALKAALVVAPAAAEVTPAAPG